MERTRLTKRIFDLLEQLSRSRLLFLSHVDLSLIILQSLEEALKVSDGLLTNFLDLSAFLEAYVKMLRKLLRQLQVERELGLPQRVCLV